MKWILFSFLLLVGQWVVAQINYTFIIKDIDGQPIQSATISNSGDPTQGGFTNAEGRLSIRVSNQSWTTITYIGAEKQFLNQDSLNRIHPKFCTIVLKKEASEHSGITISTGRYRQNLDQVTVSTMVMKSAELSRNNSVTSDDAINRFSGVQIIGTQANIRGSSGYSYGAGSRVMILLDGLPMLSADAGAVSWDYLPIENATQIEVVKGASSALYGSAALGGVINILTAFPETKKGFTKVSAFTSFNDPRSTHLLPNGYLLPQSGASFSMGRKAGNLSYVIGGNALNNPGYRMMDNTKRIRLNTNLKYTINEKWVAGINLNGSLDSSGTFLFWANYDSAYFPAVGTAALQETRKFNADPYLIYYQNSSTAHTFRNRFYYNANLSSNAGYGSENNLWYSEYNFKKQQHLKWFEDGALNLGAVYIQNNIHSQLIYGNRSSNNYASYAQWDQTGKKWNISMGARLEYYQIEHIKPNIFPIFRGGISYKILPYTTLRASAGQGFRTASVAERYANTRAGSIVIFSNPDLQPEKGSSLEFGARQLFAWNHWKGFVDAAFFRTFYRNMMEFTPWTNPLNGEIGFTSKNLPSNSLIKGIELTIGAQHKIGTHNWTIQGGYTYMNPRNLGYFSFLGLPPEDKWLKYRYRHLVRGDVNYSHKKWDFGVNVRYNSFMLRVDQIFLENIPDVKKFRQNKPGGDWVIDARIFRKMGDYFSLGLIGKNILNEEYLFIPGNLGAPRSINFQLNYQIK